MPKKIKQKRVIRPVTEEILEDKQEESVLKEAELPVEEEPQNLKPQEKEVETAEARGTSDDPKPDDSGFHISIGFVFLTIIVAVFVAILAGGLYVYFNGVNSLKSVNPEATPAPTSSSVSTTPEPSVKPSPTLSPTPEPKLTTYKVNILNGSGKIGEAGKVKTLVEKAGFKVSSTGNAANFNFKETIIQVKESVGKSALTSLKESLKDSYKIGDGEALDSKDAYDIVITVGAE